MDAKILKQFDIVYVDFPGLTDESVQAGTRPALIYSNDMCNKYSPTVTVIPFTTRKKRQMPTHLLFSENVARKYGLKHESTLLAEQITTVSKDRIIDKVGNVDSIIIRTKITEKVDVQFARPVADSFISIITYLEGIGVKNLDDAKKILTGVA